MDYSKTLNLPKTDFPMKANLSQREPAILKWWEDNDLYRKSLEVNDQKPLFILHDGPPYANGDIHLGHALNKILKDIIVKFKSMRGYKAPYVPGWDTHGLPIESQAIKKLGVNRYETDPVEFRRMCRDFALKYVDIQKDEFKRLGIRGDWDNPYLTLKPEFEAKQIEVFGEMAKKGYIYKGLKPVYWCTDCETALAEAEIEYADHATESLYVKFPVVDDKGLFDGVDNAYLVIWTTTAWTLPANMAVCLNPDIEYGLVRFDNGEVYVLAVALIDSVAADAGLGHYDILKRFKGKQLEGIKAKHPFFDRFSPVILGEYVTLEQGTGCVHIAPGHGQEDFEVGRKYGLEVLNPVDDKGYMTQKAGKFAGMFYEDAGRAIIEELNANKMLLAVKTVQHSYPHCWRCKNPVIFRATEQWFASIDGFRQQALDAVASVKWTPAWGQERMSGMIRERYDWCISRQRLWGVPIPIFYCKDCGEAIINDETVAAVSDLFRQKGSDAWFAMDEADILPEGFVCPHCGGRSFTKEKDIMDVWFDSGSSHAAVLETRDDLHWPANMYLEGYDQFRGWFQSSLLTSVATRGRAPYDEVLTHGMVVDGEGRKMSKSLGNGVDPQDVVQEYGADILRLWVTSADYKNDMRISKSILKQLSEVYRKIRNTARFLMGNLYDFNPDTDAMPYDELKEIDRWALMRLHQLIQEVTEAYDNYEYHVVHHAIYGFCVVDMSNFYLDVLKDRLYTYRADSKERRSAQTVLYAILDAMVRMLAPVLSFTAEEIWRYMPHSAGNDTRSVHLASWPVADGSYIDSALMEKWDKLIEVRDEVLKALETARSQKLIGQSLEAGVDIYAGGQWYDFLKSEESHLSEIFITSQAAVKNGSAPEEAVSAETIDGLRIHVHKASGQKCERCWVYSDTIGSDPEHPTICERCSDNV
ncbi:isoleucine--tRNA ligase [Mahella australiensis]|uniref:Isoleucine--tRNA ligase n=1 Tax=Mahella australiensis (strain DSM 15567 / CIP 107919 / 50-1 BON) TaxID=697281 RepID=F3ZX84_MAHA5|nr:isoleucine--tRNA ligase [Mahella australiensis]AEE96541.1 Isoleucyl-tRNA synthetase [Mahella australiensis 50-1 BON]